MATRSFANRSAARRPAPGPRRKPSMGKAAGVAFAVLMGALLLQQTLPRREKVVPSLPPEEAIGLLPPNAIPSQYPPLEVPDLPQPAYVVGFAVSDVPHAAYVRWNKEERAYAVTSSISLGEGTGLTGQPKFSTQPLGTGAPVAVLAQASLGASTNGILVLLSSGGALSHAQLTEQDGSKKSAVFASGASVTHADAIAFNDVDADGDADAVATATATAADGSTERTVRVYAWQEGGFVYDQPLSWTLTMSANVFPEPSAPTPPPDAQ